MNTFDAIIGSILLFGFVRGLIKGLFVEIASLAAIFLGVYGAIHFSFFLSGWLKQSVSWDDNVIQLISFCGTFGIVLLFVALLAKALTEIANFAALGFLNKILGGVFSLLKFGLVLSVVFIFFGRVNDKVPFVKNKILKKSLLFEPIKKIAPVVFPSVIRGIKY